MKMCDLYPSTHTTGIARVLRAHFSFLLFDWLNTYNNAHTKWDGLFNTHIIECLLTAR